MLRKQCLNRLDASLVTGSLPRLSEQNSCLMIGISSEGRATQYPHGGEGIAVLRILEV